MALRPSGRGSLRTERSTSGAFGNRSTRDPTPSPCAQKLCSGNCGAVWIPTLPGSPWLPFTPPEALPPPPPRGSPFLPFESPAPPAPPSPRLPPALAAPTSALLLVYSIGAVRLGA